MSKGTSKIHYFIQIKKKILTQIDNYSIAVHFLIIIKNFFINNYSKKNKNMMMIIITTGNNIVLKRARARQFRIIQRE